MTPETLEKPLRAHPFLRELGEQHVRFLLGCTKNQRFAAGDYVVREGTAADTLYLIRTGAVAVENHIPHRGAAVLETLGAGDVIGWAVLFPPFRWHVDARATRPTVAFAVDGICLREKLEADHSFGYAVTRRLLALVHDRLVRARLQQLDVYRSDA